MCMQKQVKNALRKIKTREVVEKRKARMQQTIDSLYMSTYREYEYTNNSNEYYKTK